MQSTKSDLCEIFLFIEPHDGQDGAAMAESVMVKLRALTRKELVTGTLPKNSYGTNRSAQSELCQLFLQRDI